MRALLLATAVLVAALLAGCTSISCRYGPLEPDDPIPVGYPMGASVEVRAELVGLLDESIDDKRVHYLNLVVPPGYQNRFVKARVSVPAGTRFAVSGYRRPHNPICRNHEWVLVLDSDRPLTPNRDEIHIRLSAARANLAGVAR